MNKLWIIAKSNIKKRKGNIATLFILVVFAVVLMYTSLNVLLNVQNFLKEKNEKNNGAHVMALTTANYEDEMLDIIKSIDHFNSVEVDKRVRSSSTCTIKNLSQKKDNKDTMMMLFGKMNQENTINKCNVIDRGNEKKKNSIILPMYLKVSKGYKTGDIITVNINQTKKTFEVYGFIEDIMFATPSNISIYNCKITDEMMDELIDEGCIQEKYVYNIRLDSEENSSEYEGILSKMVNDKMMYPEFGMNFSVNLTMMLGGSTLLINIIMSILAIFSAVLVIIVVLVIRFNMMMYLEENLSNIGIMEAQGYTIKQIRLSMILEYVSICIAGIIAGVFVSEITSSFFSSMVSGSIGLTWTPNPDIPIILGTAAFILIFVIAIVLRTASRLKKITTLDALRGGIQTHNFKRNHMPLSSGKMGINTRLGIKSMLQNTKQNIAVIVIVSLLSFACVLSMMIYYNFVGDDMALLTLVGMEKYDIEVASNEKGEEELRQLLDEIKKKPEIDRGVLYGNIGMSVYNDSNDMSVAADVYDDFSKLNIHTVYDGREPEYDNEIVVTSVIAEKFNLKVGDSIQVKVGDNSKSYIVCGISQQISNMGVRALLTKDGAKRLNDNFDYNGIALYVNGNKDVVVRVMDEIKNQYSLQDDLRISNINESFDTIMGTFSDSLILMCAVFVIITVIVVVLIIIMIMRMKMVRERGSIGIYKAIGYTTRQIIWQMDMAFVPVVISGGVIGAILGSLSLNKVFMLILSFCKIKNAHLSISFYLIIISVASLSLLAFIVATLISAGVKHIEPYKMITE